jgi:hypothetical protein
LFDEIELRWKTRFGEHAISLLGQTLQGIADKLDVEPPHGLPAWWEETAEFPPRVKRGRNSPALPTLLSQVLLAFRLEFDRQAPGAPRIFCQYTARLGGEAHARCGDSTPDWGISADQRHWMADQAVCGGYV